MIKRLSFSYLMMFILIWLIPQISTAQKNYVAKLGLSKVFNKQYFIANQVKVFQSFSINLETGVLKKAYYMETIDNTNEKGAYGTDQTKDADKSIFQLRTNAKIGYQVNIEGRFHPNKRLNEGLYIGIKTGYQYVDFGPLNVTWESNDILFNAPSYSKSLTARQQSWLMGGSLGCNIKISKDLFLDINLFSGYHYIELIDPLELPFVPYADTQINEFRNNHRNPIDQFTIDFNIYLGF